MSTSVQTTESKIIDQVICFLRDQVEEGNYAISSTLWESVFEDEDSLVEYSLTVNPIRCYDEFSDFVYDLSHDTKELTFDEMLSVTNILKCSSSIDSQISRIKKGNLSKEDSRTLRKKINKKYLSVLRQSTFTMDVINSIWTVLQTNKRELSFLYDVIDIVNQVVSDDDMIREYVLKELYEITDSEDPSTEWKRHIINCCLDVIDNDDLSEWISDNTIYDVFQVYDALAFTTIECWE
jgi:hypothetical protein